MAHFKRSCAVMVLLGLSLSAQAQKDAPAKPADTSRGDRMLADYFKAQTARIAERSLADIKTLDDWKAQRETHRTQLFDMLGLARPPAKTDLKPVITGTLDHADFTVEKLHFQSSPGLYVTGNLYIPKGLEADKPAPTILYVCGHSQQKKAGISFGNKAGYQHHGAWFARHGYVCLVIDSLQLGEIEGIHHGTYRHGMWWWINRGYTPAGVEAWNCIRALDYLETRKEVDKNRIGVTGRSGGGAYSWWIAALDDRIKVAVPVAGITDLENHVVDGVVEGHCDCMFMHNTYQWDYAQVAALVAPRPLLISNTDKDPIFPLDGVYRVHEKVKKIYKLYGAEKELGFHITEGPHKDTQELRIHALVWFDRYLRKEERPIVKAAEKLFSPEELRVFEKLPEDEINTKIQETFVPMAEKIEPPKDKGEFETQREAWMKALREEVFAGWPTGKDVPPIKATLVQDVSRNGLQLSEIRYDSQEQVQLSIFILYRERNRSPFRVNLHVLDEQGWLQWRQAMQVEFSKEVAGEKAVDADERAFKAMRERIEKEDTALAVVCPRGVGPTAWDASDKKQTQNRRRFMLLGQTLEGMQVWDICRALEAMGMMRTLTCGVPIRLHGERAMAGNVLYASLLVDDTLHEDFISRMELRHLKPTHRDGPIYMNISKHFDIPQAVVMAAARCPVKLDMAIAGDWSYLEGTKKALGWREHQLNITISLPPEKTK